MARVAVQAHRGSPDPDAGVGENTLGAFERAGRLGADGVELDVRLAADGTVVVCHDPSVPGLGPVAELTVAELPASVPTLAAVLDRCRSTTLNIELKNLPVDPAFDPDERLARRVAGLVGEAGLAGSVLVSSFWSGSLETLRDHHPELATGLLVSGWPDPTASVAAAVDFGCAAVHPALAMLTGELVTEAHRVGLAVATWTAASRDDLVAARSAGVDTVITDDVPLALDVLGRHTAS